jgi:hypothetical protein
MIKKYVETKENHDGIPNNSWKISKSMGQPNFPLVSRKIAPCNILKKCMNTADIPAVDKLQRTFYDEFFNADRSYNLFWSKV